jgi:hypothetical protein
MAVSTEKSMISQRKFAILPKKRSWVVFLRFQVPSVYSFPSSSYILQSPRGTNVAAVPLPGPSPLAQGGAVSENPTPDPRPELLTAFPPHTQPGTPDTLSVPSVPIPSPTKEVPMFEAVAVSSSSSGENSEVENIGKQKKKARDSIMPVPVPDPQDEVPDEVAAFLPMLEEYLRCKPR